MKYIEYLITLIVSLTPAVLFDTLHSYYSLPTLVAIANSALIAFLIYFLLNILLIRIPHFFWPIRCFFHKVNRIEGYWFEKVLESGEHPWSYAVIEYDPWSKRFSYYGRNFNKDFSINAIWESLNVTTDLKSNDMQFLFEAVIENETKPNSVKGFGQLKFKSDLRWGYVRGNGQFFDIGTQTKKYTLEMIRMYRKEVKAILGTEKIRTPIDIEKLVRHYADTYYGNPEVQPNN